MSDQLGVHVVPAADAPITGQSLTSKTLVGVAWLLSWRILTRCLGIITTLVLARILTPSDFGLVAMATAFAGSIDALSQLGLQDALVRRVGEDRRLFDTAFTLQLARATLTSLIIAFAATGAAWWFVEPRLTPILLALAACAWISGFDNIGVVEFRRNMRFDVQFKILSLPRIIQVCATIVAAIILQSYWALLFGIFVSKLGRTIMTYIVHPYRPAFRLAGWQELAGFSFWTWASSAVAVIWERSESFILGPIAGPAKLGVYLLAAELATLPISEIVDPATDAMFAAFASAQKTGEKSAHHAPLVAVTLMMCIMPMTITISACSGNMVAALLGPNWSSAQPLIAILAWLCLFSPMSYVCNAALIANNFVKRSFFARVATAAVKLIVVLITVRLTDRLDLLAASITVCVAIESCCYLFSLYGIGTVHLRPIVSPALRTLTAGGLVTSGLYFAGLAWQPASAAGLLALFWVVVTAAIVLLAYVAVLATLWFMAGCPKGPETHAVANLRKAIPGRAVAI